MRYRKFGKTGWDVSEIGFGAWQIGASWAGQTESDSLAALNTALDNGCNFIDTAQGYGDGKSEQIIARVLSDRKSSSSHIYVATKIPPSPGAWPPSPYDRIEERYPEKYLRERLERSLKDLRIDCIDLLQLHTWTRAWNRNPVALETLRKFKQAGKIRAIGISTPEHDQDSLVDLMRNDWLDSVQVIYNIFQQQPQAEFLPTAREKGVAVIVRCALDESGLGGRLTSNTKFGEGDVRNGYFAGDRLARTVHRVQKIKETIGDAEPTVASAAIKFAMKPAAVSTVIVGTRNADQALINCGLSDQAPLTDDLEHKLRDHQWLRSFWYGGKA